MNCFEGTFSLQLTQVVTVTLEIKMFLISFSAIKTSVVHLNQGFLFLFQFHH